MTMYRLKINHKSLIELLRSGKTNIEGNLVYPCEIDLETGDYMDTGEGGEPIDLIEVQE